ncbi:MAG: hypothetical protein WDZ35_14280 [Crocinitomicaceae bacterium]
MKKLFKIKSILIGLVLMFYFLMMDLGGLSDQIELRLFNAVILGIGLWLTLHKKAAEGGKYGMDYFAGWKEGLRISFGAVVTFCILFIIYMSFAGTDLLAVLQSESYVPEFFTLWHFAAIILIEGMASGLVMTLMFMQYFKYKQRKNTGSVTSGGAS